MTLGGLGDRELIAYCATRRPDRAVAGDPTVATMLALRALARRHQQLSVEIDELDALIGPLVTAINPLIGLSGVGSDVAGQLLVTAGDNPQRLRSEAAFAMLCGAAPLPASSGRTHRHRLNRGGDRQANAALYRIVLCRLRWDPRTRAYAQRRTTEGMSKPEIIRCLKRYIAREIYTALLALPGVGPEVAGQLLVTAGDNPHRLHSEAAFAMLCGAAPLPASSGRTHRHRLNRGGDRQANAALYRIVCCRLRWDPRTRAYAQRRTTEGMSKKEIIRCLKRYIAREVYIALLNPDPAPLPATT